MNRAAVPNVLARLVESPDAFLWDFRENLALFVDMDRQAYHRSVFLDDRIDRRSDSLVTVETNRLLEYAEAHRAPPKKLAYLFNTALCGSTLLSRAMDRAGKIMVYREPMALAHVARIAPQGVDVDALPDRWTLLLDVTLTCLSKSYAGERLVIIKPTVPVNFIGAPLMQQHPENCGIVMYLTLESFLLKVLRGPKRRQWATTVLSNQRVRLEALTGIASDRLTVPCAAACLWLLQIRSLQDLQRQFTNVRSLNADMFFDDPAENLERAFELFGCGAKDIDVAAIVGGEIFSRYSKNPEQGFDQAVANRKKEQLRQTIARDLADAQAWVDRNVECFSVATRMDRPLAGNAPDLFI